MGKAASWLAAEITVVAQAWIEASEDGTNRNGGLSGTDQDKDQHWNQVMANVEKRAPPDAVREGRYHYRGIKPIKSYWRDQISKECNQFNRDLLLVYNSNPTGCTEQNKINMAVAIHKGKVERMEYRFKDFEARDWKFYGAWCVLKGHRKFLPPQKPVEVDIPQDSEMPPLEVGTNTVVDISNTNAEETSPIGFEEPGRALFSTPQPANHAAAVPGTVDTSKRSRGNGAGRMGTKQMAQLIEHRAKKIKAIEDLTAVQKERVELNKYFVKNQAVFQSFMMAKAGLEANRHSQYWSSYYRNKMYSLIGGDDDDASPPGIDSDSNEEEEEGS